MTRSVRYQPILHTLYYTLHTEHAYCLSYRFFNNVVIPTVIKMVEMVEINNLLHLVLVKYGDISLVLCISTRLRLVAILSQLVKYLVILHADPCNKSWTDPITLPCSLARAGNNTIYATKTIRRGVNAKQLCSHQALPFFARTVTKSLGTRPIAVCARRLTFPPPRWKRA